MTDLPLHPALVHLPLGVAVVVPLVGLALLIAAWRQWLPKKATWLAVGLQAVVLVGALAAMNTGEDVEEQVESVVPESAIHDHEELAEAFTWASGGVLALFLLGAALPKRQPALLLTSAATLASAGTLVLGLQVGHAGGELVYVHGAASAFASSGSESTGSLSALFTRGEGEDEDDEHEEDDD